jgi:transcriptional regulator with XRE-family HTH domain
MDKGGQALKRAIHVAREREGIPSDMALARASTVSYDTLMNWYADRTVPRPAELKKVADAAGTTLVALMDAYEGRDPEPPTLVEALHELVQELREQHRQNRELMDELRDNPRRRMAS